LVVVETKNAGPVMDESADRVAMILQTYLDSALEMIEALPWVVDATSTVAGVIEQRLREDRP
jgi:hypothetical protein